MLVTCVRRSHRPMHYTTCVLQPNPFRECNMATIVPTCLLAPAGTGPSQIQCWWNRAWYFKVSKRSTKSREILENLESEETVDCISIHRPRTNRANKNFGEFRTNFFVNQCRITIKIQRKPFGGNYLGGICCVNGAVNVPPNMPPNKDIFIWLIYSHAQSISYFHHRWTTKYIQMAPAKLCHSFKGIGAVCWLEGPWPACLVNFGTAFVRDSHISFMINKTHCFLTPLKHPSQL